MFIWTLEAPSSLSLELHSEKWPCLSLRVIKRDDSATQCQCLFLIKPRLRKTVKSAQILSDRRRKGRSVCAISNLPPADYSIVISLSASQFETQLAQMYLFHVHHQKCTAAAWLLPGASAAKHKGSLQLKRKKKWCWLCIVMCYFSVYSISSSVFSLCNELPGLERVPGK